VRLEASDTGQYLKTLAFTTVQATLPSSSLFTLRYLLLFCHREEHATRFSVASDEAISAPCLYSFDFSLLFSPV
jgi:hypothetical protein